MFRRFSAWVLILSEAYYGRQAQRTMDQQNAVNAMSGVGGTPYGAGVTGNTMSNFNIDWQNSALQRALAGHKGPGVCMVISAKGSGKALGFRQAAFKSIFKELLRLTMCFLGSTQISLGCLDKLVSMATWLRRFPRCRFKITCLISIKLIKMLKQVLVLKDLDLIRPSFRTRNMQLLGRA